MDTLSNPDRIRRLKRYTWWSLAGTGVVVLTMPMLQALRGAHGSENDVVLLVAVALVAVQRARFTNDLLDGPANRWRRWEHLASLVLALATWGYAASTTVETMPWTFVPAILASMVVTDVPGRQRRLAVTAGIAALSAVTASTAMSIESHSLLPTPVLALAAAAFVALFTAVDISGVWFWQVASEAEQARETAAELAVAKERLRFAADLHDVQGHHLQAIVLKSELTERLIGIDDGKAAAQAGEVTALARSALSDTREVVHGYRSTRLRGEVENAMDLLRAAGIDADVHGDVSVIPPPLEELFGAVVREGTTNLLRHSTARHCALTLTGGPAGFELRLANDGAPDPDGERGGSGITGLRDRFAAVGGTVHDEREPGGRFAIVASAPQPGGKP